MGVGRINKIYCGLPKGTRARSSCVDIPLLIDINDGRHLTVVVVCVPKGEKPSVDSETF